MIVPLSRLPSLDVAYVQHYPRIKEIGKLKLYYKKVKYSVPPLTNLYKKPVCASSRYLIARLANHVDDE